jgi:hypothetical protein
MMRPILALLAGLLTILPIAEATDFEAPDQRRLTELLTNNSMQGIWDGRHYLQYFANDGTTRYLEQGGTVTEGRWRVDESGRYCSLWPPSEDWVCYSVLVSGTNIYWKSEAEYYPAEIHSGDLFAEMPAE